MKKMTNDELGTLLTREMMSMMADSSLSYEQRGRLFCAIVNDESIEDGIMSAFANSLKVGYSRINSNRIKGVEARRNRQKEYVKHLRSSTEINVDERRSTEISVDERLSTTEKVDERLSTTEKVDERLSTTEKVDERLSTMQSKAKQSKAKQSIYNPLNPPSGGGESDQGSISIEEILALPEQTDNPAADLIVSEISTTYPFQVNQRKLRRCVFSILKKNSADEILGGFRRHVAAWKLDEWRFAPGKITDWLYDHKYLDPVREKKNGAAEDESVGSGCGTCGVEIA